MIIAISWQLPATNMIPWRCVLSKGVSFGVVLSAPQEWPPLETDVKKMFQVEIGAVASSAVLEFLAGRQAVYRIGKVCTVLTFCTQSLASTYSSSIRKLLFSPVGSHSMAVIRGGQPEPAWRAVPS